MTPMRLARRLPFGLRGSVVGFDTEATGLNGHGAYRVVTYEFGNKKKPDQEKRRIIPARPFAYSFCDLFGNTAYVRGSVDTQTRAVTWNKSEHAGIRELIED